MCIQSYAAVYARVHGPLPRIFLAAKLGLPLKRICPSRFRNFPPTNQPKGSAMFSLVRELCRFLGSFTVRALIVIGAVGSLATLAHAETLTLNDVFAAALRRADTVAIDLELIRQAEETYKQSVGAMLPNIIGTGTMTRQQQVNSGLNSTLTPSYQPTIKFTAVQTALRRLEGFCDAAPNRRIGRRD